MPDHVVQSCHDGDGSAGQSTHSYQSVWMAHWMRTSCHTAPQVHSFLPPHLENKENEYDAKREHFLSESEVASDISTSAKRFRELTEATTVKIMNERLATASKNLINQRLDCQPFPMFNLGQSSQSSSAPKNDQDTSCHRLGVRPQIDHNSKYNNIALGTDTSNIPLVLGVGPPAIEATSREFSFKFDDISRNPEDQANTRKFLGDSSFVVARPSRDEFIGSTPHVVPYRFNKGRTPGLSFISKQLEDNQLTSLLASKEHFSNTNYTILEHERCNYRNHSTFLLCEKTMDNHSNAGNSKTLFLRQNNSPVSLHDMETTRMCTTASSVDGLPGGLPKISQTKHSRLLTETEVNLSKVNRIFRESRVSTKFSEHLSLCPVFGLDQQGVKLTSEVCLKNESSTETDTMDMDALKDDHLSGDDSPPSNKDIKVGPDPLSQATKGEVGCKWPITMLPDINEELPALPAAASSMDNKEPSSSKTQSLDVGHFLSHAEQLSKSKFIPLTGSPLGPEPSSRWVKRLKPIASDSFALGTKSSNLGEASSHEKAKKFSRIMEGNISSSEMILGTCHGKEQTTLDQTASLLRNGDSSLMEKSKAGRDIMLSHFWVQRWCQNRAAQNKPKAAVVCEPQSSNLPFDEFQKKQFPSIAAMALMGKAMSGFQPCEFQKRGSFIVWNS